MTIGNIKIFTEIMNDPFYYEVEGLNRQYLLCNNCGYIPYTSLDYNTKFLDAHCKCGSPIQSVDFTLDEIEEIKYNDLANCMGC